MKQVTMVSLYGQKRGDLERLIKKCWEMINVSKFRRLFEPYHMNQIHGTIVGFGKTPYELSFQVQLATSKLTLIGWPHKNLNFTDKRMLWDLRHEIETKCNIKHKYENDNDLFMVLGEIKGLQLLTDSELEELESESALLE
ncbi:MAG: hypothetical protein ACE5J3_01545 [Methanosarcinales archaeon]